MRSTSPSVVIVRLDGIGDALALTPLLAALRSAGFRVGCVLREANARIFSRTALDRVHIASFPLRATVFQARAALEASADELSSSKYDVALVATEDPGGYRLAQLARIPIRIGFENGWGKPLKTLWVRRLCTQTIHRSAGLDGRAPHECEVLFNLGEALVAPLEPSREIGVLRPLILDDDPPADVRVALQITQKWEQFGVTTAQLAALARRAAKTASLRPIGAQSEDACLRGFEALTGLRVDRFHDLSAWKAAIAGARALLAPDSGAVHVAGMTGTPVVALFPAQHFTLQQARWSPWAAPHRSIALVAEWPLVACDALEELLAQERAR